MIPWDDEAGFYRAFGDFLGQPLAAACATEPLSKGARMPVSDHQMIEAWKQVLTLSKLEAGQSVTVLTGAATHPQTLQCALIASQAMGAIVNRLDLPPVNGEKALSRDAWPISAPRR